MASPSRNFFESVKDKLSRKSSNKSTKSTKSTHSTTGNSYNPFSNPTSIPVAELAAGDAPPPSYGEAMAGGPTITVQAPSSGRGLSSPTPSGASRISVASASTPEDPYAFLSTFDTIFLIDDSGSMAGRSWREVKEALRAITPICTSHDSDGIDVYFLNARNPTHTAGGWTNIRTTEQVENLFSHVRPSGGTPTGTRINHVLKPYMRRFEQRLAQVGGDPDATGLKPVNMIVITDGVPTDDPESIIVQLAKKLDALEAPPYQVGIQFFQVGNEAGAAAALRELDDNLDKLSAGVRDIVDTVTWTGRNGSAHALSANGILKVVLGAVVRRLDRRRASGESQRQSNNNNRLRP